MYNSLMPSITLAEQVIVSLLNWELTESMEPISLLQRGWDKIYPFPGNSKTTATLKFCSPWNLTLFLVTNRTLNLPLKQFLSSSIANTGFPSSKANITSSKHNVKLLDTHTINGFGRSK